LPWNYIVERSVANVDPQRQKAGFIIKKNMIIENVVLENERVLLRALQTIDLPHLLPFAINEPQIWKYSLISAATQLGMEQYINAAIADRIAGHSYPFIVYDKLAKSYAGSTRFYDINRAYNTLQLGYTWYGTQYQGTGLNRHCKYLLFEYAFETLQVSRVELRADNDNAKSIAAMKAVGCTVDGILRANMPKPAGETGRRDSIVLSILQNEWQQTVKQKLALLLL
jgi:N-acetyltransferase